MLKILVAVERVPDPAARLRFDANGAPDVSEARHVVNPYDEVALEAALRLLDAGARVELIAVAVGDARIEPQIRAALAMGADRAVRVDLPHPRDPQIAAKQIAAVAEDEAADLLLLGLTTSDLDDSQLGARIAGALGWPQATHAIAIELTEDHAQVTCQLPHGRGLYEIALPCVVTVDLRFGRPRLIPLPAILKAKGKLIEVRPPKDESDGEHGAARSAGFALPPARHAGRMVADVDELIDALRNEARII